MTTYRAYFFDQLDHSRGAIDLDAADDTHAMALLSALDHPYHVSELWQGDRMVGRRDRSLAA